MSERVNKAGDPLVDKPRFLFRRYLVPDDLDSSFIILKGLFGIDDFKEGGDFEVCIVVLGIELDDPFKQFESLHVVVLGATRLSGFDLCEHPESLVGVLEGLAT